MLLSPIWAWSFTGIALTGHDSIHGTFAPKETKLGNLINEITPFITMDCFIWSSWIWNKRHLMHHKNVNIEGVDDMNIRGTDILEEQLWSASLVAKYWWYDFKELCFNWDLEQNILLRKLKIVGGAYFRFYYVFYRFINGDPSVLFSNAVCLAFCMNYIGFLSHALPVTSKGKTNNYWIWAMRETWDIFPRSGLMNFLHCGNGGHCSHHMFPYLPRSLFWKTADVLDKHCKDEYREITTIKDELWLFWNRHSEM